MHANRIIGDQQVDITPATLAAYYDAASERAPNSVAECHYMRDPLLTGARSLGAFDNNLLRARLRMMVAD
jgi:hypothetical protein